MKPKTLFHTLFSLCFFFISVSLSAQEWTQLGPDIDGESAGDLFGNSVSLSADGSRMAIGAYYNDGSGTNAGHVQVYDWNGSGGYK